MDIYLVRHGEAAAGWGEDPDPGLSSTGLQQAQAVADTLMPVLPDNTLLISSPLRRALETAAPLADRLGSAVRQDSAFREIPAPVALPERQAWLRGFMQQRWDEQPASLHEWRDTAWQHLRALDRPAVVFSHFLVINAVVGQLSGREETLCFWPDNGSITRLAYSDNALSLVAQGAEMKSVVN